ncbi:MAG: endolytic transglycosylase MltG, partial [Mycobacteriales bacterium]
DLEGGARKLGLTPYDVVKIASLVEAETPLDADRAKVARVVLNRLAKGMPLQLDSTVNYVRTERRARLSLSDIEVESPYNTYLHKGLPPTPIDSPGEKALAAALNPEAGDWIYFITIDKAGHSLFTSSYSEFLKAKAKAQRDGVY